MASQDDTTQGLDFTAKGELLPPAGLPVSLVHAVHTRLLLRAAQECYALPSELEAISPALRELGEQLCLGPDVDDGGLAYLRGDHDADVDRAIGALLVGVRSAGARDERAPRLDAPELAALLDEWRELVGESVAVYGEVIDG